MLCSFLYNFSTIAQAVLPNSTAVYLSEEEYKKAMWQGAKDVALQNDIAVAVFKENYEAHYEEIVTVPQERILKKIQWIEDGTSTQPKKGTKQFLKRKSLYEKEIKRGVRDAILNDALLLKKLLTYNENDRIVSFHSDVVIDVQGLLTVTETIKIYNGKDGENDLIKRGITREFPTRYTNKYGLATTVPFNLKSVSRNGKPDTYMSEKLINGQRYYFGKADEYLERGYYTYVLTYTTARQLIFHSDKDELYWNVNGTGWKFNIGKISCKVTFPDSAKIIENNCYTGGYSSTDRHCTFNKERGNVVIFSSIKPLEPNEGMTISATIQKGVLAAPSVMDYWIDLLKENYILPALVGVLLLLFLVNFIAWWKVGRDPDKGVIIPQFAPPAGMSPADCGYLLGQKYSPNLFAASIVDYAVNRLVDIEVKREGFLIKTPVYYFKRPTSLKGDYKSDHQRYDWYGYDIDSLFGEKAEKGSYNANIAGRYNNLSNKLEERWLIKNENKSKGLFALNDNYVGLGYVFMFFVAFATIIYFAVFRGSWLLVGICSVLVISGFVMQTLFMKWLRAYTREGRKRLDDILGFKSYLKVTEEKIFSTMTPPEKTLQLFEKYLPYAIALQCENEWSRKFETVISTAIQGGYQPAYFSSAGHSFSSSSFATDISSGITSTIASASTPPSSSSGGSSSGGGFSGGGGGGGGGGGW